MKHFSKCSTSMCLAVIISSLCIATAHSNDGTGGDWFLESTDPDWSGRTDDPTLNASDNSWMFDANGELRSEEDIEADYAATFENHRGTTIQDAEHYGLELDPNEASPEEIIAELGGDGRDHNGGDECAIWLCLPMGFLSPHCNGPRAEMISRIFRRKSPAPSWSHCTRTDDTADNNNGFEVRREAVAFVPPDRLVRTGRNGQGGRGCQQIGDSSIFDPPGCIPNVEVTVSQVYQHGELFGTAYYDIADGVIIDEREHCDVAEQDRHPSCFNMVPDDVTAEMIEDKSPQMIFTNMCPEAPLDIVRASRGWCWDHSANHCSLAENQHSRYCSTYFDVLRIREESSFD